MRIQTMIKQLIAFDFQTHDPEMDVEPRGPRGRPKAVQPITIGNWHKVGDKWVEDI